MSQQINLFDPALRKRRIVLTAARVAMLCGVTLLGVVGLWFYEQQVIAGLRAELTTAQGLLAAQRSHIERISAAKQAKPKETKLESDIKRLEAELDLARTQMETLKGDAAGEVRGFAEYLRAFSRQSVDGLWLTGVDIRAGGEITIRGRTLNPALVPDYIQRLDREQALRGRSFAALEMGQPARVSSPSPGQAPVLPRFLEFSLATAEPVAASGTGTTGRTP